ncbi:gamma-glutamylcyclotransferase [Sulfitobacter sp. F26204]|uniref:gamma-glutamylcyclotransferase family protein n=1 Tax=Sulfitobacter sp. F26204 TaxID=2996014 RepID=UPI00225E6D8B|nr:gamma-glutamylcyclotransferase family protein [Sulfitobacter sp. F26204]MCX7560345.1 gamma-glutamylcyclotransferase [Sulfitobacter sp. F26204]
MTPYFFGYGSLVNRNTHAYPDSHPARLTGWRRAWVPSVAFDRVFLSVIPDPDTTIEGLIAAVPGADWDALDARETGYVRLNSGDAIIHPLSPSPPIAHYAVPAQDHGVTRCNTIILSYLDVVVQGFLREYGEGGVQAFFDTTDGWDTPILNDRAAPQYPRHQTLSPAEIALVDSHLARLSAFLE